MDRLEFQRRAYEIIDDLGGNDHAKEAVLERLMIAHDEAVEAALTEYEETLDESERPGRRTPLTNGDNVLLEPVDE